MERMEDIVNRLRAWAEGEWFTREWFKEVNVGMIAAADEIERLRAEIARKQESIEWLKPFAAAGLGDAFENDLTPYGECG
jgi:hypothetical protein